MRIPLPQIFVSHSRYDLDIRNSFEKIFAGTGVKPVWYEFEQKSSPDWNEIRNSIHDSEAVFLLLGPKIMKSEYTKSWIAFEVGLSCAFGKHVWVFEQMYSHVDFPIPYVTDYLLYRLQDSVHVDYVTMIIEAYGERAKSLISNVEIPRGLLVQCSYCHIEYSVHQTFGTHCCPSCRKPN